MGIMKKLEGDALINKKIFLGICMLLYALGIAMGVAVFMLKHQ